MSTMLVVSYGVSLLIALLLLQRRRLITWGVIEVAVASIALLLWRQRPDIDVYLTTVSFCALRLVAFVILVARSEERDVHWSANRASLAALLVYLTVVPAMLQAPIDGDEPFYLLAAESIMHDRDFDLSNQYREPGSSVTGRTDLGPQLGDPVGPHGEVYTRHPPLLPLLIIPGLAIAGLPGAIAVIAIFGALLIRSTLNLMEDEGISRATQRIVFPFFAFGPPVLFYSTRIWPEVPAAFLFVEALRGVRDRRVQRWLPAVIALGLLKLRFALVGLPLVLIGMGRDRRSIWRRGGSSFRQVTLRLLLVVAVVAVPMLVAWLIHGNPLNVHAARELLPWSPKLYLIGSFGLLVDGSSGLLFQAPFYLLGVFAIMRWRSMPESFRMGCMAALLYLFYLVPRSEWHGGWSPALRYVVIFTPVLALGAAVLLEERGARRWLPPIAVWTIAIAVHGVVYPWRLFHIANGENVTGEMLSTLFASDFSRLFPSLIRLNSAAVVASIALVAALLLFRFVRIAIPAPLVATTLTMLIAIGFTVGRQAGRIVEFEDIHVKHDGGALYPEVFTVARFRFRGGWIVRAGDSLSFLARAGRSRLHYRSDIAAVLQIGGRAISLPSTGGHETSIDVQLPATGRVDLRCLSGEVNLDRLEHE